MKQNSRPQNIQTVFLKNMNLFYRRHLSLSELYNTIEYFLSELSKISFNPVKFLSILKKTLAKVFKISFIQGILIIFLIFYFLFVKALFIFFRPIIPSVHKIILHFSLCSQIHGMYDFLAALNNFQH